VPGTRTLSLTTEIQLQATGVQENALEVRFRVASQGTTPAWGTRRGD